jgi:hypothetical protein
MTKSFLFLLFSLYFPFLYLSVFAPPPAWPVREFDRLIKGSERDDRALVAAEMVW